MTVSVSIHGIECSSQLTLVSLGDLIHVETGLSREGLQKLVECDSIVSIEIKLPCVLLPFLLSKLSYLVG